MSLTNPNTPVSQQDLQDFYHKLLPYMGGSFGLIATGIDSANLYSTTERVVGQWIDGKPLYQKVITLSSSITLSNSGWDSSITLSSVGLSNINHIVDGFIIRGGSKGKWGGICFASDTTYLKMQYVGSSITFPSGSYIVLQYTKTTDSAVESYGTDTTYSTDEHVVGSWIDGSPLYQKVFQPSDTISIGTSWTNLHDVSSLNIDVVTKADIHTYPNAGNQDIEVEVYKAGGYIRAKAANSINYYNNGFLILQYTKTT